MRNQYAVVADIHETRDLIRIYKRQNAESKQIAALQAELAELKAELEEVRS